MKIFSFLRRPLKLLLYGALLMLLCTVAMIFTLQYRTDRQTLDNWLSNYTYIGVICPDVESNALLEPIPEDTWKLLEQADTVQSIHSMKTYAAKLMDGHIVVDHMMTTSQLQQRYFAHAKIKSCMDWGSWGEYKCDRYSIDIVKEWGSDKIGDRGLFINMLRLADEPAFEIGDEIFFNSGYQFANGFVIVVEFSFETPAAYETLYGMPPGDIYTQNPFVVLGDGDKEKQIWTFLEETGMLPYYEKFSQLDNNLAVRAISDFYALPKTATDRLYITDGRAITEKDAGKKVCMVSQNLATRNRYGLGDVVTLSIAEESYSLHGWENGNPMPEDELITSYAPGEGYEIIGIYNQIGRDAFDPLYYSHTDIFVPVEKVTVEQTLPYACSFQVLGVDYDSFMAETLPALEKNGCIVKLADTGWQDVEDAFYAMEVRCNVMFWCAILSFVAAAIVFVVLLFLHLRKEYGLQRLMGAYRHEAYRVYLAAITAVAVPALAISGVAGYLIVKSMLQNVIAGNLLIFILVPVALLVVISVLLFLLVAFCERGSLRKIIM